jgi:hypothetical protein
LCVRKKFFYWTFFDDDDEVFNVLARCVNICLYIVGKSKYKIKKKYLILIFIILTYMYKQE